MPDPEKPNLMVETQDEIDQVHSISDLGTSASGTQLQVVREVAQQELRNTVNRRYGPATAEILRDVGANAGNHPGITGQTDYPTVDSTGLGYVQTFDALGVAGEGNQYGMSAAAAERVRATEQHFTGPITTDVQAKQNQIGLF